jgi:hypothetical protein
MHISAASASAHTRASDRTFFTAAAIVNALIIIAGFGYSTYSRIWLGDSRFGGPTLTAPVRLHAAISLAWTILLIAQARLIAVHRIRLHRQLGLAGALLAVLVVGSGWAVMTGALERAASAGDAAWTAAVRFVGLLGLQELGLFVILIGAALSLRTRGTAHKRLMLLGTLALIPAAATRLPGNLTLMLTMGGLPEVLFVLSLGVHDRRTRGRVHAATLWGGGVLVVTAVARSWVADTDAWLAFAKILFVPGAG